MSAYIVYDSVFLEVVTVNIGLEGTSFIYIISKYLRQKHVPQLFNKNDVPGDTRYIE